MIISDLRGCKLVYHCIKKVSFCCIPYVILLEKLTKIIHQKKMLLKHNTNPFDCRIRREVKAPCTRDISSLPLYKRWKIGKCVETCLKNFQLKAAPRSEKFLGKCSKVLQRK